MAKMANFMLYIYAQFLKTVLTSINHAGWLCFLQGPCLIDTSPTQFSSKVLTVDLSSYGGFWKLTGCTGS